MNKKNNYNTRNNFTLSGRNIYRDKKNRIIYYDFLTKQGYLIDKGDEHKLFLYKNRIMIIFCAAVLCFGTFLSALQATIGGILVFLVTEAYFRIAFFPNLKIVNHVNRQQRVSSIQAIIDNKPRGKIILLICLYLAFSILIVLNAYYEDYSLGINIFSGLLSLIGIYFLIIHIIALTKLESSK